MKKKAKWLCILVVLLLLGCIAGRLVEAVTVQPYDPYYSYQEVLEIYKGDPGLRENGFVNTEECTVRSAKDAVERAKLECTISYNRISYAYDEEDDIWVVLFYTKDALGNCQEVYLGSDGITRLIVYGE